MSLKGLTCRERSVRRKINGGRQDTTPDPDDNISILLSQSSKIKSEVLLS